MAAKESSLQIAIIGAGFCGIMTAVHLLRNGGSHLHIHLVNKGGTFGRGVAYNPHTARLLLNVPNNGMSAFPGEPEHFINWLISKEQFAEADRATIAYEFSPRKLFGEYLDEIWQKALADRGVNKQTSIYHKEAVNVIETDTGLNVTLDDGSAITADMLVLATGNEKPNFIKGLNLAMKISCRYFGDPWKNDCIKNLEAEKDILVIGTGLTMVDTVIGLVDNGFKGVIHTISPHGYRLKPWKETKEPYIVPPAIAGPDSQLLDLLQTLNKHRKIADNLNQSIYPLIDSLRPRIQALWLSFDRQEKQRFIDNLSPFWDRVRHRLPTQMHTIIEKMRTAGTLITYRGTIDDVKETKNKIAVDVNVGGYTKHLNVQRIINCTGPQTNITRSANKLVSNMAKKGLITPGPFDLGINARADDYSIISADNLNKPNIFIIGGNLKGMLWESTAVPELRAQAQKLAAHILQKVSIRSSETITAD